jgi:hypothetical protein
MIDDDFKYIALSGSITPGGPSTWHVTDWDQRRLVSVTMDEEQDDESLAIEHFSRYSDQLSPGIYRIRVSHTGEIISTYTDPKDDKTCCEYFPFLQDIILPDGIRTIRRDELEELERLGPDVDLVAYPPCRGEPAKKVKPKCPRSRDRLGPVIKLTPWAGYIQVLLHGAVCPKVLEGDEPVDASAPPPEHRPL